MKPVQKQHNGFTIIEMMVSLAIIAMLMTAVAFAFDAAVTNYQQNQGIYETVTSARQALLRITTDLRSAQGVGLIGTDDPDNSQISILTNTGNDITYRFNSGDNTLYYDDNTSGASYKLCENVTSMTFDRTEASIERDTDGNGTLETIQAVRDVRIAITVTDEKGVVEQKLAAAALIRKNM